MNSKYSDRKYIMDKLTEITGSERRILWLKHQKRKKSIQHTEMVVGGPIFHWLFFFLLSSPKDTFSQLWEPLK